MNNYLLSLILFFSLVSCQFDGIKHAKEIRDLENKQLTINLPLKLYSLNKNFYDYIPQKKYKIVTYIDTRCYICLNELGLWNEYIKNHRSLDVEYLLFLRIDDFRKVEYFLQHIDFEYPIIADMNNTFFENNKLPMDKALNTFLIDSTNRIVLIGNPAKVPALSDLYIDYLEKRK